jgi:cytochrome c oxidase subunit 1
MPRRVADYDPIFKNGNMLSTIGAIILGLSTLPFLYNAVMSLIRGPLAGPNPWRALGLEWTLPSPPPIHNFPTEPEVFDDPYGYGERPIPAPVEVA